MVGFTFFLSHRQNGPKFFTYRLEVTYKVMEQIKLRIRGYSYLLMIQIIYVFLQGRRIYTSWYKFIDQPIIKYTNQIAYKWETKKKLERSTGEYC